ncbi:MAG: hypothetical protein M3Q58_15550 [Bacteroidota bacterium]|nr:hypothetical protein [Bacteroidota bacterium]
MIERTIKSFLIYFVIILSSSILVDILNNDSVLDIMWYNSIAYAATASLIIVAYSFSIELLLFIVFRQQVQIWKKYLLKYNGIVSLILLFTIFILYLIVPRFEAKAFFLWGFIIISGESLRHFYLSNYKTNR